MNTEQLVKHSTYLELRKKMEAFLNIKVEEEKPRQRNLKRYHSIKMIYINEIPVALGILNRLKSLFLDELYDIIVNDMFEASKEKVEIIYDILVLLEKIRNDKYINPFLNAS